MKTVSLLMAMLILSTGCASMFSGTTEKLHVSSNTPGTRLYMGSEEIGKDNATVTVAKKHLKETYFVAKKEGCMDARVEVATKYDATSLLGVLIDLGIISILVVDWGINRATTEAERRDYVLNPTCPDVKAAQAY